MEVYGIVYCATNKVSGKKYVGITRKLLRVRISAHFNEAVHPFGKALRKYGMDAFDIEVIDTAGDSEELSRKEQHWIAYFNCMAPNGYNLTTGGEQTFRVHPDVGRRISLSKMGKSRLGNTKPEDLLGRRFGRLLVTELHSRNPARWTCQCDCGKVHSVLATALKGGKNRSCGCLRREVTSARKRTATYEHRHTPEYNSWFMMRAKRNNDERWKSFIAFREDMGSSGGLWLLRRDSSLPYSKANCYWGTRSDCALNMKKTVWIEYGGKRQTQARWAAELGVDSATIHKARHAGTLEQLMEHAHG